MMIRVTADEWNFVISGVSSGEELKEHNPEAEKQAKALAYVLARGLHYPVLKHLYHHLYTIIHAPLDDDYDEYVKELCQTARSYEV